MGCASVTETARQRDILTGRGIAYAYRSQTVVAEIAEVEVNRKTGRIWVKRFVCAHDCGLVINPEGLRRTVECGMLHSLSRVLHEEVRFDNEKVTSVDWVTHPTMTHADTPETIDVVIVNGDPNPEPARSAALRRGRDGVQADARGGGERGVRRDGCSSAPRAVQIRACAGGAEGGQRVARTGVRHRTR